MSIKKIASSSSELQKVFMEVDTIDPKIEIEEQLVILYPFYWNYSFILNILPGLVGLFILVLNTSLKANLYSIIAITGSLFLINRELKFCNKILINLKESQITIIPNIFLSFLVKAKSVKFTEIKVIDYYVANYLTPSQKRYVINLTSKNRESIRLISTDTREHVEKLVHILLSLI